MYFQIHPFYFPGSTVSPGQEALAIALSSLPHFKILRGIVGFEILSAKVSLNTVSGGWRRRGARAELVGSGNDLLPFCFGLHRRNVAGVLIVAGVGRSGAVISAPDS